MRRMTDSGKARELGKTAGFIKAIVDAKTDEILGATALCEHGSEIVQLFVELMNAGATARMVGMLFIFILPQRKPPKTLLWTS